MTEEKKLAEHELGGESALMRGLRLGMALAQAEHELRERERINAAFKRATEPQDTE